MSALLSFYQENVLEAGCDEAGRGCMAGPVVAAAVILPADFSHPLLNDSKKMSHKNRVILREVIEREAIAWDVQFISSQKIDEINILNASILGMQQAALALKVRPESVLIDGNRFHSFEIPHTCFVKGDGRFLAIAAASVLAKTHRYDYMEKIAAEYPAYCWKKNKGYPTKEHRESIIKLGLTEHHRKTFQLKNLNQLELDFD